MMSRRHAVEAVLGSGGGQPSFAGPVARRATPVAQTMPPARVYATNCTVHATIPGATPPLRGDGEDAREDDRLAPVKLEEPFGRRKGAVGVPLDELDDRIMISFRPPIRPSQ